MNFSKKTLLVTGLTVTLLAGGILYQSHAFPTMNVSAATTQSDGDGEVADDNQQGNIDTEKGTNDDQEQMNEEKDGKEIKDQEKEDSENSQELGEKQEQSNLQAKAKISKEKAIQLAQTKFSGNVVQTHLEDEDGVAVYNVTIKGTSQTKEVKVNATTGKIERIENADNDKQGQEKDGNDMEQED